MSKTFYLFDLKNPDNDITKSFEERFDIEKSYEQMKDVLSDINEKDTFSSRLLCYLRQKHLTSKIMYDRAYIDRRLLNKIIRHPKYHPAKQTVFQICIALQLDLSESNEMLSLAGYSFSPNSKYDGIFAYVIKNRIYDLDTINEFLYREGYKCIGELG